jgi:hypothetical protein
VNLPSPHNDQSVVSQYYVEVPFIVEIRKGRAFSAVLRPEENSIR